MNVHNQLKRISLMIILVLALSGLSTFANATLMLNDHNFVYDSDLNITWNQPYAMPLSGGWAYNVGTIGDVTGWRLPTLSEMSHLYFVEMGNQLGNATGYGSFFPNLRGTIYWASDTFPGNPQVAYTFNFNNGSVNSYYKNYGNVLTIVVHDDNIAPIVENVPVPEPSAFLLFGAGFVGLAFCRRKTKEQSDSL